MTARRPHGARTRAPSAGSRARWPAIDDLRAAVEAARAAAPPDPGDVPADASEETVEAGGATGRFVARRPVEGPWAPLVDACRTILDAMVEAPLAAVGLVLRARRVGAA